MGLAYFCAERCALCAFVARNGVVLRRIAYNLPLFIGGTVYLLVCGALCVAVAASAVVGAFFARARRGFLFGAANKVCAKRNTLVKSRQISYYICVMECYLCPRNCGADRSAGRGVCGVDGLLVSRISVHNWEEPCISGKKGSGTVFFAGCNLHCRFCQNYRISALPHGVYVSEERLADILLYVQTLGVANINLVTPTHFSDKIARALRLAKPRLTVPVVYNTSGYDKVQALAQLQGLVDVYLPDLKFASPEVSRRLAGAPDYFDVATRAITEMRRQQPQDVFDDDGYIVRGVVVRHLVLPSFTEDSKRILDWLAHFDKDIYVSLMSQYFPARTDDAFPQLNRRLFRHEYDNVRRYFFNVGLHNGYEQDVSSATEDYLPDFDDGDVQQTIDKVPKVF